MRKFPFVTKLLYVKFELSIWILRDFFITDYFALLALCPNVYDTSKISGSLASFCRPLWIPGEERSTSLERNAKQQEQKEVGQIQNRN